MFSLREALRQARSAVSIRDKTGRKEAWTSTFHTQAPMELHCARQYGS
jgi:hypothetical protein